MSTKYDAELGEVLFNVIAERVERDGIRLDSGYDSAIREGRPWCIATSLTVLAELGWKLSVVVESESHVTPANVDIAAVHDRAVASRKARYG